MDFSKITEGYLDENEIPDMPRPDGLPENTVFHYNREERVKRAPKLVQDYYSGKLVAFKPGLFKALVSTKANRFMLFTLVICFFLVIFLGFFGPKENVDTVAGVKMNLSAFTYEEFGEKIYVDLKFDPPNKKMLSKYEGEVPVKVTFSAVNNDQQVIEKILVVDKYLGKSLYEARAKRLSEVREEKKKDKHKSVKVGEFCLDVKTSFNDYDIISVTADVDLGGETKSVSTPVKNLTSLIR